MKYFVILLANSIFILFAMQIFSKETLYHCGHLEEKPRLAFGLVPTWFDNKFQFNDGAKAIISSSASDTPYKDIWVKGSEKFRKIVAYHYGDSDLLRFKAIDWNGTVNTFALTKVDKPSTEKHVYQITKRISNNEKINWIDLNSLSCSQGGNLSFRLIFVVLFMALNVVCFKLQLKKPI